MGSPIPNTPLPSARGDVAAVEPGLTLPPSSEARRRSQVEQAIAAGRNGSRSALGRVLEGGRKYLLMVANKALDHDLKGKVGASDLVQDTFVEAQRDFDRFKGTTEEELFAWLTAIMANRLSNNVRRYKTTGKRNVDREIPDELVELALANLHDSAETPSALAIARDEEQRVQAALQKLDATTREILILRTWERKSFEEIGQLRGCTADAARKQWGRAVRQLERLLIRKT